jgi:hypothetical protein
MSIPEESVELSLEDARKLADAVRRIDQAMKSFITSGLNRKALVVLLHDATSVTKRDINAVLNGLENLGDMYLEKATDPAVAGTKKGTP